MYLYATHFILGVMQRRDSRSLTYASVFSLVTTSGCSSQLRVAYEGLSRSNAEVE